MEPVTIASIVAGSVTIFATYQVATLIERRRNYEREFNLRREMRALETRIEMGDVVDSSSRRSPGYASSRPSGRSSASTDHGFTTGVSVGSSFSGPSSCSSDSGSSSSSDSGSCM